MRGVPFAPYYTPREVFESPQQRDREYFVPVDHPKAGRYDYPGLPWRMTETPPRLGRAPLLGNTTRRCCVPWVTLRKTSWPWPVPG